MLARERALESLAAERFDVVVIGGGITGAGVAFDAATRGFSVALVEKADYASGTSSRSSKLVHGGLRYLQNFDLGLVREALLERRLLVKLAPHLVRPLQLVVPRVTMIFDYTGLPALMMPSGLGQSGLPVAVQVVGKPFDDALCLSVGRAFQAVTAWHRNAPPEPIG